MKNKTNALVLSTLLAFISCGKGDSSSNSDKTPEFCQPTKNLFSLWLVENESYSVDLSNCDYGQACTVRFGSGLCDDNRGDFIITYDTIVKSNYGRKSGDYSITSCDGSTVIESGDYKIECENTLRMNYDSDGSSENFN